MFGMDIEGLIASNLKKKFPHLAADIEKARVAAGKFGALLMRLTPAQVVALLTKANAVIQEATGSSPFTSAEIQEAAAEYEAIPGAITAIQTALAAAEKEVE